MWTGAVTVQDEVWSVSAVGRKRTSKQIVMNLHPPRGECVSVSLVSSNGSSSGQLIQLGSQTGGKGLLCAAADAAVSTSTLGSRE